MGIESFILSGLVGLGCGAADSQEYRQGCSQAAKASFELTEVDEQLRQKEKKIEKKAERLVLENLGETGAQTMTGLLLMTRMATGGKTRVGTKGPLDGDYFIETNLTETKVGVGWEF